MEHNIEARLARIRVPAFRLKVAEPPSNYAVERPKLYLETTIPSYLTSQLSRNLVTAGRQRMTRVWWHTCRAKFDIYVSDFVLDEVRKGDAIAARRRLDVVEPFTLLGDDDGRAELLAGELLKHCCLPEKARIDACHIAIAAVHKMRYLLTWNCSHLANASLFPKIDRICLASGLTCPDICTPRELLGDFAHERSHR